MNDQAIVKTILALLVVEKVITKKKANDAMRRVEANFLRGIALPLDLDQLINVLEDNE